MQPAETSEQERQRRLHAFSVELSGTTSALEIADILRDVATIVLNAYRVRLWSLDGSTARLVARETHGVVSLADTTHPIAHAIETAQPLWLPQAMHAALVTTTSEPMRAACVIPLAVDDVVIGAIDFAFSSDKRFFTEEREFLTALSCEVAVALERTRLPQIHEWPTGSQRIETVKPATLRVLIVDADADAAAQLATALETMGHEAVVVYNSTAALCAADEYHAHVAFVDLEVPTGYELVARLCRLPHWERTRFVPIRKPFELAEVEAVLRPLG